MVLTKEQNERLCRVEGDAPMGQLVRRFWMPFLLSEDLPRPDCPPVRVRLLGEDLVAFRDTDGRVGLVDKTCAHRCADLFYGRNEEGGLRCVYHGWKFDVTGQCTEAPTEQQDYFRLTVKIKAYPVEEAGGILWTYMGPPELKPARSDFEFLNTPEGFVYASWSTQACNFVQAIEGGIDTAHSIYLHSTVASHNKLDEYRGDRRTISTGGSVPQSRYRNHATPPVLHTVDTDFGLVVGGQYAIGEADDYWRYNLYLMPFYTMPPSGANAKLLHAFVPIDDYHVARWSITYHLDQPFTAVERSQLRKGSGVHVALQPGTHTPVRVRANDYLIDREDQEHVSYTGIAGIGEQDFAVQEGMGPIQDRSRERLGMSDGGISRMRQRMLQAADDLAVGVEPYAASHPEVFRCHAGDALLPATSDQWQEEPNTKQAILARW
jgi:phenylpropionate dioxygenase-like ring-hydroxylating dioxygenase large terminal subunit